MLSRMTGVGEEPWQSRLILHEILNPSGACQEVVEQHFRPEFELLLGVLDELLPGPVAPHVRHQLGFSVVGQCLFYRIAREVLAILVPADEREAHYSLDDLADHITAVALAAVGKLTRPPGVAADAAQRFPESSAAYTA
jgi:hypothetical protein